MSAEGECVDAGRQCLLLSFPGGPEAGSEGHKTALSPDVDHLPQTLIMYFFLYNFCLAQCV